MTYQNPLAPIRRTLVAILIVGLLCLLFGCSAEKHMQMAIKKDPDVWKPKQTELIVPEVKINATKADIDEMLKTGSMELVSIAETKRGKDSVVVRYRFKEMNLSKQDSLMIAEALGKVEADIDCPDVSYIEVPVPTITFWQKVQYLTAGALGLVLLVVLVWTFKGLMINKPP